MTVLTETTGGRLIPRQPPRAEPCDVRFWGIGDGSIIAVCEPCGTEYRLEGGHTTAELTRFTAQHQGKEDSP